MRTQLVLLSGLFGTCAVAALAGGPWAAEPGRSVRKSVRTQVVRSEPHDAASTAPSGNGVVQFVATKNVVETKQPAPRVGSVASPVITPVLDGPASPAGESQSGVVKYAQPAKESTATRNLPSAQRATVKAVDAEPALPVASPQVEVQQREPLPINQPRAITQPVVEGAQSDLPPLPKFEVPGLPEKKDQPTATSRVAQIPDAAPTPSQNPIPRPEQTVQAKQPEQPVAKPAELSDSERRLRAIAEQQRLEERKRENSFHAPEEHHPAINNPVVKATEAAPAETVQPRLAEQRDLEAPSKPAPTVPQRQPQPAVVAEAKPAKSPNKGSELSEIEKRTRALAEQERIAELRRTNEFKPPQGQLPAINSPVVKAAPPASVAAEPNQPRLVERAAVPARPESTPTVSPQQQAAKLPAKQPNTETVAKNPAPVAGSPRVAQAPAPVARRPSQAPRPQVARNAPRGQQPAAAASDKLRMPPFIAQQVAQHVDYGQDLAGRGATHSARSEYMRALDVVAHALDAQQNSNYHRRALREALTALREADDLTPHVEQGDAGWRRSVEKHTTPVLKSPESQNIHPFTAMQKYCEFAGQRLVDAMGHEPSASKALYGMARLELWMETPTTAQATLAGPRAIVLHQAALRVDANNFKAANELGVLFAKYGQYEQARAAFLHSIRVEPQPITWKNLAKVSHLLGDRETAHAAKHQQDWLAKRMEEKQNGTGTYPISVTMVDPITFANLPSSEHGLGPTTPRQPSTQPASVVTSPTQPGEQPTKKPIVARVFDSLQ